MTFMQISWQNHLWKREWYSQYMGYKVGALGDWGGPGGCGSLGVKTREVLGKPGWAGVRMCISPSRWPINLSRWPKHSSKLLHCSHNFPAQVGPKLNCNKSGCFGGVASVPFFGICSSFSLPLFVEEPDILFSFPREVQGDLSLSSFPSNFYEVKVLLLFHLLNYVKHVHGSKIKLYTNY